MAIIINNDVANSPRHIYDEVLQRLIKKGGDSQAKSLIRKYLTDIFMKNPSTREIDSGFMDSVKSDILTADLLSNLSITALFTEQGVEGLVDGMEPLPDIERRTFGGASTTLGDFIGSVSLSGSYPVFNRLISTPFDVYFDSEAREFTLKAIPTKTILVANLEINISSRKLSGVAKAVYSYILERTEESFEDIVNGLYRSLTTKFKNRYKKFVHPDTIVSIDDVLQGTNLPSEMDYEVLAKNPEHLFIEHYSDEEFIDEMGKLYDDNPVALNQMIVEMASRPLYDCDKIRSYIESKDRSREWIISVFGLVDFRFLEDYRHSVGKSLNLLAYLNDDEKLGVINKVLTEARNKPLGYLLRGSISELLTDILTENPELLSDIENPEDVFSWSFIPGFSYVHSRWSFQNGLSNFIKFTDTNSGLFVIYEDKYTYESIKSFVTVIEAKYEELSKEYGLSISHDDLMDLFTNRVIRIDTKAELDKLLESKIKLLR